MSDKLQTLSKNLAGGMSRRRAFWQFLTGVGVVGALTGRKAQANSGIGGFGACSEFCSLQAQAFIALCLTASASCKSGSCAEITLIKSGPAPAGVSFNGSGGSPFICVPTGII